MDLVNKDECISGDSIPKAAQKRVVITNENVGADEREKTNRP